MLIMLTEHGCYKKMQFTQCDRRQVLYSVQEKKKNQAQPRAGFEPGVLESNTLPLDPHEYIQGG